MVEEPRRREGRTSGGGDADRWCCDGEGEGERVSERERERERERESIFKWVASIYIYISFF
jgi:hypothetical protein